MKKLISILTTLTMLFAFAAIPAFAEGETAPDFITDNLAYGKPFYAAKFTSWYAASDTNGVNGSSCPVGATPSWATDGNIKTKHTGIGRVENASNPGNGVITYVDLGAEYMISEVSAWQAGKDQNLRIYTSLDIKAEPNTTTEEPRNENHPKTLVGTTVAVGSLTIDGTVYNERKLVVSDVTTADVPARYVFFEYNDRWDTNITEIVVKGTPVTGTAVDFRSADNIAYLCKTSATNYNSAYYSSGYGPNGNDRQWSTDGTVNGDYHRLYNVSTYTLSLNSTYKIKRIKLYLVTDSDVTFNVMVGDKEVGNLITDTPVSVNNSATVKRVGVLDLSDSNISGSKIQLILPKKATAYYSEIYVEGEEIIEAIDFTDEENIAYNKTVTAISGNYYSSSAPSAEKQLLTDGNITTYHSGKKTTGGIAFSLNLEDDYLIDEIDLYTSSSGKGFDLYVGTTLDEMTKIASYLKDDKVIRNVNGTRGIYRYSYDVEIPVVARFIKIHYPENYDFPYNEIFIKGEKVTTLTDSLKSYSYDAATGVKASFELFNGAETPSTAGKVFFAAYNGDVLVGTAIADAASLETGASATIAPAAFAVTAEPTTVKAYYWTDKLVPILDSAIDLK